MLDLARLFLPAVFAAAVGCGTRAAPAPKSTPPAPARAEAKGTPAPKPKAREPQTPAQIAAHATPAIVSVRTKESLGTGFVVRPDGWVATNFHVLAGSAEIVVTLADQRDFPVVAIVGADRAHDLVILRIDAEHLPALELGDSDAVRPGDPVVAIGHPLGLEDTVSNGLVSAVRRDADLEVLQISAPIAPGSSGGPLFNDRGQVIGVATAILRGGQNLNFGLPARYLKRLLESPEPRSMLVFAAELAALQPSLPHVERHVPELPLKTLKGCDSSALALILKTIGDAIDVGAPLYNRGDFAACYHLYEGAAQDLERRLPKVCSGPRHALADGRKHAAKLGDPSAQAWAMRDAFDGLVDVIRRRAETP